MKNHKYIYRKEIQQMLERNNIYLSRDELNMLYYAISEVMLGLLPKNDTKQLSNSEYVGFNQYATLVKKNIKKWLEED
jgi:hypothetical protein